MINIQSQYHVVPVLVVCAHLNWNQSENASNLHFCNLIHSLHITTWFAFNLWKNVHNVCANWKIDMDFWMYYMLCCFGLLAAVLKLAFFVNPKYIYRGFDGENILCFNEIKKIWLSVWRSSHDNVTNLIRDVLYFICYLQF